MDPIGSVSCRGRSIFRTPCEGPMRYLAMVAAGALLLGLPWVAPSLAVVRPGPTNWVLLSLGEISVVVGACLLYLRDRRRSERTSLPATAALEVELAASATRLRETEELRRGLVRAITHDLRTPLQVIVLQAERWRALAKEHRPEKLRRSTETILESIRRISAMLRDLDESVQLERGEVELALENVRLPELAASLLSSSQWPLDTSRITFEVADDLPPVRADPRRLEQILASLLSNALRYSHPGSPVRVVASASEGEVLVSVADQGPGIDEMDLPRIFEIFHRGKGAAGEGFGLGLYLVRRLVEFHGGRVWVQSREGKGSTFTFALPAAKS